MVNCPVTNVKSSSMSAVIILSVQFTLILPTSCLLPPDYPFCPTEATVTMDDAFYRVSLSLRTLWARYDTYTINSHRMSISVGTSFSALEQTGESRTCSSDERGTWKNYLKDILNGIKWYLRDQFYGVAEGYCAIMHCTTLPRECTPAFKASTTAKLRHLCFKSSRWACILN